MMHVTVPPRLHFHIGSLPIYAYGVIIACGMLVAFLIALYLFKKRNYKEDNVYIAILVCIPLGIICARIYYVLFDGGLFDFSNYSSFWDIFNIRDGGIAIYGGVIGGALGLLIVSRWKKVGFFALADVGVICLIIAQAIGRWGNFTNQEAFGLATDFHFFPITVWIENPHAPNGVGPYLATFFYESILNVAGFAVLLWLFLKRKPKTGVVSAWYLVWYGVVRSIVEPFRTDSLLMFGSSDFVLNRVSFMLSLVIIALGVLLLVAVKRGWISQKDDGLLKNAAPKDQPPVDEDKNV